MYIVSSLKELILVLGSYILFEQGDAVGGSEPLTIPKVFDLSLLIYGRGVKPLLTAGGSTKTNLVGFPFCDVTWENTHPSDVGSTLGQRWSKLGQRWSSIRGWLGHPSGDSPRLALSRGNTPLGCNFVVWWNMKNGICWKFDTNIKHTTITWYRDWPVVAPQ